MVQNLAFSPSQSNHLSPASFKELVNPPNGDFKDTLFNTVFCAAKLGSPETEALPWPCLSGLSLFRSGRGSLSSLHWGSAKPVQPPVTARGSDKLSQPPASAGSSSEGIQPATNSTSLPELEKCPEHAVCPAWLRLALSRQWFPHHLVHLRLRPTGHQRPVPLCSRVSVAVSLQPKGLHLWPVSDAGFFFF